MGCATSSDEQQAAPGGGRARSAEELAAWGAQLAAREAAVAAREAAAAAAGAHGGGGGRAEQQAMGPHAGGAHTDMHSPIAGGAEDARLLAVNAASAVVDTLDGSVHRVRVLRVYDGDTLTVGFFDGHGGWHCRKARLLHVDAPEMRPLKSIEGREAHVRAAVATRAVLVHAIVSARGLAWAAFEGADKYGRDLVTLRLGARDGPSVNEMLLARGLALGYEGGTKGEWDARRVAAALAAGAAYAREAGMPLDALVEASHAMGK